LGKVTFDSKGHALSLTGTIQDITKRKISENRLSKSEKRLKLLADNSNDFIWVLDPVTMHFIYVSPSCENLLGYSTYEMLQNPFEMILVPEIREIFVQRARNGIAKFNTNSLPRTSVLKEVMQLRKDGTTLITEVSYKAYFNQNTGKIEIQGVTRDVTVQIMVERALKQSEEKYRMLAENMEDVVWTMDTTTHRFLYMSPSVVKLRGFTPDEIYSEPMETTLTLPFKSKANELIIQRCADFQAGRITTDTYFTDEIEQTCKDGATVWTEIISHLWLNNKTGHIELHGVSRNLNERKRFELTLQENEARLRDLNATKDKFFSIIAHDLKNPFNAIIGFSNLLIDQVKDKDYEGIDEYATIIKDSSLRAMSLLNNLLIWSRSQTGRMEFNPEYFELVRLIGEVTELLNDSAKQKTIEISSKLPHNILVLADKEMIGTILRNLISNAIKFTHPGGLISISAFLQKEGWVIEVSDNGMGIKKEFIHKLFRIDETHSTKGTQDELGSGLGLLLCKEFISKHEGKIWVESEFGKGSKFSFLIPK
jgi:PAS domain S-box-containing protein